MPDEDVSDEELVAGRGGRPVVRAVTVLIVVLMAAWAAYLLTRGDSSSPAAQPTRPTPTRSDTQPEVSAANVFVPGRSTAANITGNRISISADLVNNSDSNLTVAYPLRLPGAKNADVTVLYAELAANGTTMDGTSEPPPRVTHVAAGQRVALWIGLRTHCAQQTERPAWPTRRSRIAIPLAGYATSASFNITVLFGRAWLPHGGRLCASQARS